MIVCVVGGEEGQRGAVTDMLEQIWALVLHMRDTPRERVRRRCTPALEGSSALLLLLLWVGGNT